MNLKDIDEFIISWNNKYPIDRWWREKHKVAFNSKAHRCASFLDMIVEFREELLIERVRRDDSYVQGDWITKGELSNKSDSEEFEKLLMKKE